VSEQSAQKMLQYLNRIQRKDAERPDGVETYDENWKVKNNDTREENFSKGV
jgi:predicted adenine nucleotide alpha hydrolase (AANH) superfamily ATPase